MTDTFAQAFSRPQVLTCTTLSEVLPLDLLVLQVQVAGWGWLEISGAEGFQLRQSFWRSGTLDIAVPVRAALTLEVGNLWGRRRYPIDTSTRRDEVWRLPTDLQPAYVPVDALPGALSEALPRPLPPPGLASQVPGFKLRANPAAFTLPALAVRPLPAMQAPPSPPSHPALPAADIRVPIDNLEARMAQARIAR